jgi:homoserine kinase type II
MSVYTSVSQAELAAYLENYAIGELVSHRGISAGIENTNYFVTTEKQGIQQEWVLTLFEKHSAEELVFFMDLIQHLANHGVPTAHPAIHKNGNIIGELNGKPATLVSRLSGATLDKCFPNSNQCQAIGAALANFHKAGKTFTKHRYSDRGTTWRHETGTKMLDYLQGEDKALLQSELAFQQSLLATSNYQRLRLGVIHADLFRDNAMFDGDKLTGIIDWYYAANDILLYDLAVVATDWCYFEDNSGIDEDKLTRLIQAYHQVLPLTENDQVCWQGVMRAAALRFWLSRLCDWHFPREGELTQTKDPDEYKQKLKVIRDSDALLQQCWVDHEDLKQEAGVA